ncbi:MAG: type VI secretion system-associated protein TagO [Enterobacteriaceae bacterium]|jgi:type VI secretion system protein VasI|nr:type VI secretion system-associated protein TagO [Enterobacteriaceae bacterium]
MKNRSGSVIIMLMSLWVSFAFAAPDDAAKLKLLTECANDASVFSRLDCYDRILRANVPISPVTATKMKHVPAWEWAYELEKKRTDTNETEFLSSHSGGDNPNVLITTPALGRQPPRPVLLFSCIDNITRIQVMLVDPVRSGNGNITLKTNSGAIKTQWFIRDNGYVLESSRGLPGIQEIQQLIHAEKLTLGSDDPVLNGLVFNLSTLPQAIAPLRSACHW